MLPVWLQAPIVEVSEGIGLPVSVSVGRAAEAGDDDVPAGVANDEGVLPEHALAARARVAISATAVRIELEIMRPSCR
jgi:hypothetical protein